MFAQTGIRTHSVSAWLEEWTCDTRIGFELTAEIFLWVPHVFEFWVSNTLKTVGLRFSLLMNFLCVFTLRPSKALEIVEPTALHDTSSLLVLHKICKLHRAEKARIGTTSISKNQLSSVLYLWSNFESKMNQKWFLQFFSLFSIVFPCVTFLKVSKIGLVGFSKRSLTFCASLHWQSFT